MRSRLMLILREIFGKKRISLKGKFKEKWQNLNSF